MIHVTTSTTVEISEGLTMARFEGRRADIILRLIKNPEPYVGMACALKADLFEDGSVVATDASIMVSVDAHCVYVDCGCAVLSEPIFSPLPTE